MDPQHTYSYQNLEQGSRPRLFQQQNMSYYPRPEAPGMGGLAMNRDLSDASTRSSNSNYTGYTDASSPNTVMTDYPQSPVYSYNRTYEPRFQDSPVDSSSFQDLSIRQREQFYSPQQPQQRPVPQTPQSLGWTPSAAQWKSYSFVVKKGKEPYFELLPDNVATYITPQRVYLDKPSTQQKNVEPCQFPNGCTASSKRPADLERHYKNVHASSECKDKFACDYPKCERSTRELTRKDHLRDHYKDYHKEDIGHVKNPKNGVSMSRRERAQAEQIWQDERQIDPHWWRCAKCLNRIYIAEKGWECETCKQPCEQERVVWRSQRGQGAASAVVVFDREVEVPAPYAYPACAGCGDYGYVPHGSGTYQICPLRCQGAAGSQQNTGYYSESTVSGNYVAEYSAQVYE